MIPESPGTGEFAAPLWQFTALTTAYTLGDIYPKMRHSLHWKLNQAPWFYGLYAVLVGLSAIVTLACGNDLGVVVDGVEALNGILLPSALIFLVLLANDKPVLGPWTNNSGQNWIAGLVAWTVTTLSLAPLVTTFYPNITLKQCVYAFAVCTGIGLAAGVVIWRLGHSRHGQDSLEPDSNKRPAGMSRAEWREVLKERRAAWRSPRIDTLQLPVLSIARRIGLLTLRGYVIFAIVIMAIKLVQVTTAHH